MVRARKKAAEREGAIPVPPRPVGMDVNGIVSYNIREIRERRGWTQQHVAERLAVFTGHELPQASISAMERGFDGDRKRRFDAHELYLLAMVFGVPIGYFFLPPPETGMGELADTNRPIDELYVTLLGREHELAEMDERLEALRVNNPARVSDMAAALFGGRDGAVRGWAPHYRTWRKQRLAELAKTHGDRLDDVARFLAEFANEVTQMGPSAYLQATAYKAGEDIKDSVLPTNNSAAEEG